MMSKAIDREKRKVKKQTIAANDETVMKGMMTESGR